MIYLLFPFIAIAWVLDWILLLVLVTLTIGVIVSFAAIVLVIWPAVHSLVFLWRKLGAPFLKRKAK